MSRHVMKKADSSMMPPAPKHRMASKDAGTVPAIGNIATTKLLEDSGGGKAIPGQIRARMEQSFGVDLKGVRVDDSPPAREHAEALNAEALLQDGRIHWSSAAPPVESAEAEPLLAHELAHIVQQRDASVLEDRVSSAGEMSEVAARTAAGQAMAGQSASFRSGGAVAGAQRQPKPPPASKAFPDFDSATRLLTAYLQKVANTTPPQNIKKSTVVRDQLRKLALSGGPVAAMLEVDKFVDADSTSSDPATMAKQFVSKVPRISADALAGLAKAPFIDRQAGFIQRATDLAEKSGAGGGDMPKPPGYVSPEDQAREMQEKMAAMRGGTVPAGVGPVKVDVLQLGRIFKGVGGVVKPKATKPAAPQAEDYPPVTAAIAKIPKNALIPKGKADDGSWADAQEFASALARELDIAQKSSQDTITMSLGDNYAGVKDREALRDAVESIIAQIRKALPHHASAVKYVDVNTGKSILTRGIAHTE